MASNYTTNYQLNQWAAEDRVLRTEFNADNAKLDAALAALAQDTAAKASQEEVTGLKTVVAAKADKSALDALSTTVNTKASQAEVSTLTTTVNGKASQTELNSLKTTVTSLTATVSTKAAQSELNSLKTTVTAKADKAAVEAGDLWVKLGQWTSAAAGTKFSVDVSAIDFTQYWQVRVLFWCGPCAPILVQINGDTGAYAYRATQMATGSAQNGNHLGYFQNYLANHHIAAMLDSQLILEEYPVGFFCRQAALHGGSSSNFYGNHLSIPWQELETIDFTCAKDIPAGAQVLILGLKK